MWYNNKHIISRSFGVAFVVADDVQSFIFISCWWRKIDLRTISSGRFRINKCILYQVISRNTIEQIERTHGFDRKRMKQKKMKKKVHHVIESVGLIDHPSFKTKTHSHNYWWKQLLFAWPICASARLSTRSIARTHACTANSSSNTFHENLNNSIALWCTYININIIIKLDAHHKFRKAFAKCSSCNCIHITAWYRSLDLIKKVKVHITHTIV